MNIKSAFGAFKTSAIQLIKKFVKDIFSWDFLRLVILVIWFPILMLWLFTIDNVIIITITHGLGIMSFILGLMLVGILIGVTVVTLYKRLS